jgi:hypothetical protein
MDQFFSTVVVVTILPPFENFELVSWKGEEPILWWSMYFGELGYFIIIIIIINQFDAW